MKRILALPLLLAACGGSDYDATTPRADDAQLVRAFPTLSFDQPLFLAAAPGDSGRLYVVEQTGQVKVFDAVANPSAPAVFLDLDVRVSGEEGLLGLAFHPQFASNRTLYAYYSPAGEPRRTRLSRFTATSPTSAGSEQVLFDIIQPAARNNHKGGSLAFGPDGFLYVAVGDGGGGNDPDNFAQSLASPLGKILRVTATGAAPADNPFVGQAGAEPRVWAYGLRNPWRMAFDGATLWAGDVGQNAVEEIDQIVRGGNYGWRAREGSRDNPAVLDAPPAGAIGPVFEYEHGANRCSVTGGYVYRGSAVPSRVGQYFFADFCSGEVWALRGGVAELVGTVPNPSSFGVDGSGELYVVSLEGGLYRLAPR